MTLPSFLTRIHNAAGPLLDGIAESELGERLEASSIVIEIDEARASDPGHRAAFRLAVNLTTRLYPRLALEAPADLASEGRELALSINPGCDLGSLGDQPLKLSLGGGEPSADRVVVGASGWSLSVDEARPDEMAPAMPPAAMAAAALGVGELFRALFADRLAHGRSEPSPFALNLLSLGEDVDAPPLPEEIEIGSVHLAGCGAVGQAAAATLRELPVSGTLYAVDHEPLDEGNLQRYLLSGEEDVGTSKPTLIVRAFEGHLLTVEPVPTRWGADSRSAPGRETVLAALDTKQGRIELQASLPRETFNAWTQPEDVGVSRHQAFGVDPCLACLGWPRGAQPSQSERIAEALGEGELRVLRYLLSTTPVGEPLQPQQLQGTRRLPLPEDASRWTESSLLADLIERFGLPAGQSQRLAVLDVRGLYRDAVCAGMLMEHGASSEAQVSVPLAHQSALAGILLASWLVIDRVPGFRDLRNEATQARYDVLRGGDQVWPRVRERTEGCLCFDPDFTQAHRKRWREAPGPAG